MAKGTQDQESQDDKACTTRCNCSPRVREVLLGHEVIGLDRGGDVMLVDAQRHPHKHVLWPLCDFAVDLEQVRSLKGLVRSQKRQRLSECVGHGRKSSGNAKVGMGLTLNPKKS